MLTAELRLGPYEVVSALGAGGMGEVYRARDTRLGRDVAIKVLRAEVAGDPERVRRFEKEARTVASLSHPNILALFDVGSHEGQPYLVTELLEGRTLAERIRAGDLTVAKAVEFGAQIAHGLAAAHEHGIVHRDLKPGNVFVTKDGVVKILDFGLARLRAVVVGAADDSTAAATSGAGTIFGTAAYMSPEQARGLPADQRSDIFSLGAVVFEMLSGERPFRGDTATEVMAAILRDDPPALPASVPPVLNGIVRRCLEKSPDDRFQSARDLAFDLALLARISETGTGPRPAPPPRPWRAVRPWIMVAAALVAGAGLFLLGERTAQAPVPSFKRITLRRGTVGSARFTPDFQSIVYSARWAGGPSDLFVQRLASADARSLGVSGAHVVGTAGADVAILQAGTLVRLPLEGGSHRELLKDISDASLDASGNQFAIVRKVDGHQRLEYPVGHVLLETKGLEEIWFPLVSPDGTQVAFVLQASGATDLAGDICVLGPSGRTRTLSKGWKSLGNRIFWSANGKEIWFSASREGWRPELHAVTLSGKERLLAHLPGDLAIQDIAPDGRMLISFGRSMRFELRGRMAGDTAERDLSWLDGTSAPVLAPDGTQMVFQEWGEGGGIEGSTYYRRMDGSPPTRLCEGVPDGVSPDWTKALVQVGAGENISLKLVPIGAGEATTLPRGPVRGYVRSAWHPDKKRIVILGTDAEGQRRLFVQEAAGGPPRPFARAEEVGPLTADGRLVAAMPKEGEPYALFPIDGGETRPIPFLKAGERPIVFSDDGRSLYVTGSPVLGPFPVRVQRLDLKTGRREPWLDLAPPESAGVGALFGLRLTPNGRFYAYGYLRSLMDLFLVQGLK